MTVARRFHDATTHTPHSVRSSGHALDWDIKPFPFKVYTAAPAIALPRTFEPVGIDTLAAIASGGTSDTETTAAADAGTATHVGRRDAPLDLDRLATLLYLSAGVTKKKTYPGGGEVLFRAAASTGALYQTEVYVAAGAVDGLAAGLYHFCPGDFMLRQVRAGDVRGALAHAAADAALAQRAAIVVLTAIYWRNTWKYQARGFRHLFWDSGTMLANVLAVGQALDLAPKVITGFVDDEVNHVVGIDGMREGALELVAVGREELQAQDGGAATAGSPDRGPRAEPHAAGAPGAEPLPAIALETLPLSSREVDYPSLRELMQASRLVAPDEVRAWRAAAAGAEGVEGFGNHPRPVWGPPVSETPDALRAQPAVAPRTPSPAAETRIPLPAPRAVAGRSLSETIQRRGSTRQFSHAPLQADELATALWAAAQRIPADVPLSLVELFLIVNAVDGLGPGAYVYRKASHALELIRAGELRDLAGYLALEQPIAGDAAAVIFFLARLDEVLAQTGDRGYRLVNLDAGIAGGRAYLAAYALGFGASGLTFYDRLVVEAFAPVSAGMDAIFVTALGRSVREPRPPLIDRISRASRT